LEPREGEKSGDSCKSFEVGVFELQQGSAMADAVKPGEYIGNGGEPQLGIPYPGPAYGYPAAPVMTMAPPQQMPPQYYVHQNPYSAGMRPPNAIYGPPPPGMGLQETFFADTPAPFECSHCGKPGLTNVKYVE